MANINSNKHGLHVLHYLRELQIEKVSSYLAIDLSQDIAGFGSIERESILGCNHLRWNLVLLEELLVHLVVVCIVKDNNNHHWMSEDTLWASHHVVEDLLFDFLSVSLIFSLNEKWLLNLNFELIAGLDKGIKNLISIVVLASSASILY